MDREAFRTLFSLDDESLEKAARRSWRAGAISDGSCSASAGLSEMSGRLDALRERAERFYKPRGKVTELAEKKRALSDLQDEREKLDTLASTYAELVRRRDEAKGA